MSQQVTAPPPEKCAPPDADADRAWDRIMAIARDHCLIVQAYGGTATLATPSAQREVDGVRARVLHAHNRREVES